MAERDERTPDERAAAPIAVVGGGLCGSLLSLMLARRGFTVDVYERRDDMRTAQVEGGRSINLAMSERGLNALRRAGLEEQIRALCIPMRGRMIHALDGQLSFQPYGKADQYINSISRQELNKTLMSAAEAHPDVNFHFNQQADGYSRNTGKMRMLDTRTDKMDELHPQVILATDGAYSSIRRRMQTTNGFDFSQSYLAHGYKELSIPSNADGTHRMEKHALHIWPRQDFMLIALPNQDGSFTVTLFMPFEGGPHSFASIKTPADALEFFHLHFPDALALMPELAHDFFANPTGSLITIKCAPYHHDDHVLIMGDAAHAIVPFYGQGMNAAFEDCTLFDQLLDEYGPDWASVLPAFSHIRKPDADAIAELAMYNYTEMRDLVARPSYKLRKKLDATLHSLFPDAWVPLYTMVTFTNMPYAEALARSRRQDAIVRGALLGGAVAGALGLGYLLSRAGDRRR
jgi:kynurenine 3-monooxygenase